MRGESILVVFFLMFSAASILIPYPLFPGHHLSAFFLFGSVISEYIEIISALINGVFYGAILWTIFIAVSRRLATET